MDGAEPALLRLTPSEATTLDRYELHSVLDRLAVARVIIPAPVTVSPQTPIAVAVSLLARQSLLALVVVEQDRPVGLLTPGGVLRMLADRLSAVPAYDALSQGQAAV